MKRKRTSRRPLYALLAALFLLLMLALYVHAEYWQHPAPPCVVVMERRDRVADMVREVGECRTMAAR